MEKIKQKPTTPNLENLNKTPIKKAQYISHSSKKDNPYFSAKKSDPQTLPKPKLFPQKIHSFSSQKTRKIEEQSSKILEKSILPNLNPSLVYSKSQSESFLNFSQNSDLRTVNSDDKLLNKYKEQQESSLDFLQISKNLSFQFENEQNQTKNTSIQIQTPFKKEKDQQAYQTPNQKTSNSPLLPQFKNQQQGLQSVQKDELQDWNFRNKQTFKESLSKDLDKKTVFKAKQKPESQEKPKNKEQNSLESVSKKLSFGVSDKKLTNTNANTNINSNTEQLRKGSVQLPQVCILPYPVPYNAYMYQVNNQIMVPMYFYPQQSSMICDTIPSQDEPILSPVPTQIINFLDENFTEKMKNDQFHQQKSEETKPHPFYKPKFSPSTEQKLKLPHSIIEQIGQRPVKPLSPFDLYFSEKFSSIQAQNPLMNPQQIQKQLFQKWIYQEKELDKQAYQALSEQNMKIYYKDIRQYFIQRDQIIQNYIESKFIPSDINSGSSPHTNDTKKKIKYKTPKQLFKLEIIEKIKQNYSCLTPQQKKSIIDSEWKELSKEQKIVYVRQSRVQQQEAINEQQRNLKK